MEARSPDRLQLSRGCGEVLEDNEVLECYCGHLWKQSAIDPLSRPFPSHQSAKYTPCSSLNTSSYYSIRFRSEIPDVEISSALVQTSLLGLQFFKYSYSVLRACVQRGKLSTITQPVCSGGTGIGEPSCIEALFPKEKNMTHATLSGSL